MPTVYAAGPNRSRPPPTVIVATVTYHDVDGFADWLVSYGADVRVLDPPEVRDAVVRRLKEIVNVAGGVR